MSNGFRKTEELSQNSWLEGQQEKKRASGKSICRSENGVKAIKNVVEIEGDLKTEHLVKLKIDDKNISDHLKRAQGALKLRSL